jgi:outer membrane receptor protein involved in Fe transport
MIYSFTRAVILKIQQLISMIVLIPPVSLSAGELLPTSDTEYVSIGTISVISGTSDQQATIGGTSLKQSPLNAHVVTREEIERLKFVDPDEFLDRIPGETQVRNLRIPNGGKSYTIPMLDGIPLESPYEGATQRLDRVNTSDIERVEVIKGPSSALYGNNAFGGVVNVISREPPVEPEGKIWTELGSFSRQRLGVSTGGRAGKLGYFVDANVRRTEGQRDDAKNDRDQASIKLLYDVNDSLRFTVRAEHLSEDTVVRGDLTRTELTENPDQAGGLNSATDYTQDYVSLKAEQSFENGSLDGSVVWREKSTIGLSRFSGPKDEDDSAISSKIMYRHNFLEDNAIIGFESYNGEQFTKAYGRTDTSLIGPYTTFENELALYAWFAQYQAYLTENLILTSGVRYENITLQSSLYENDANFSDISPKFGLTYDLPAGKMLWLNISKGFYAPGLKNLFNIDSGNPDLQPEDATNMEIGLRGSSGDFNYDFAVYHTRIKNYLVTQTFGDIDSEYLSTTNAGQVTVKGIESVIEYAPYKTNWRVGLTHTFALNTYDSFVSSKGDFSGNDMNRSPKHHVNARLAWQPIGHLVVEFEGDFYSTYFSDDANTPAGKFKRDERFNIRMTYNNKDWSFWANALNLTDTREDRATYSRGQLKYRTADGRAFYTGVSYKF